MKILHTFIIILFVFLAVSIAYASADETKIHIIDVGTGDAVLVQTYNSNILIDAGPDRNSTALYLQSQNITDVDLFMVTSYSPGKTGGILEVMNRTRVHKYRDFGSDSFLLSYQRVKSRLDNESIVYSPLEPGERIIAGNDVFIDVLPVNNTSTMFENEAVLKITAGNISTLLLNEDATPDITLPDPIQILRVADYGSRLDFATGFIHTLHPEVAVISSGARSEPNQATIMELEAAGAQVYRTDNRGTVLVTTDGEKYTISTNKKTPSGGTISLVSVIETRPPE